MYKIKFDGSSGTGLYFVATAKTATEAKEKFYKLMLSTDKIKGVPQKTNKAFIKGVKMRSEGYYIVKK